MEAEDNKGIERQRMNYDQELHLYEKLRINYSNLIKPIRMQIRSALQFLKFLFLVRVENYGTKDILRFE